ncbi:MAG TPA: pilus assembly protein N-terminal domain-containing protein [Vicinamibacterales bacterium]|nr:pilus assembly protein N-terminal domain-containing protein [Vicinamibacterales bacterium]
MKRKIAIWILVVAVLQPGTLLAQVATQPTTNAAAAAANAVIDTPAIPVQIVTGRSTVLEIGAPIMRVSLTNPDIADAMVTSNSQLLLHGKTPGTISMFVWERAGAVRRYDISVGRDVERLSAQMKEMLPNEAVQVTSNGRNVVLSGRVSTKELGEKAVNLATAFVERKEEVVNLLAVQARPSNQVLLRVRFAEVSRTALTELGISLFTSPTGIENTLGRVTTQQFAAPGYSNLEVTKEGPDPFKFGAPVTTAKGEYNFSDFLNLFILSERYDLGVLIKALQTRGLFQSLAEPNLVAESGKEASFLAGGEFPIPVAQAGGGNAITIEFKEFGVRLNFTPTVDGDRIHLKVRPEVSTLDFANGIQLNGFRVPALVSRRTSTELELRNGQTFAIAGLLNNSMTSTMTKIPGIGDIPILGYLFRSKAAQKNRTELVVMITPQLLQEGSVGVTRDLPRLREPYLPALRDNEAIAPPPPPFQGSTATPPAGLAGVTEAPATTAQAVPAPIVVQSDAAPPNEAERRALEREEKAAAEREIAEARAVAKAAAEQAKLDAEERKRQEKAAKEQAKRDEEAGRRKAEADRKAAEAAARQAEAEKKKQAELDKAAEKVRAAEAAYQAELAKTGTTK